jgi:hypothetical protein
MGENDVLSQNGDCSIGCKVCMLVFQNKVRYQNLTSLQNSVWKKIHIPIMLSDLKVDCLHPVACTRSGSGFPSNATLF